MKNLFIGLTLFVSMSSIAETELKHGGKVVIKLQPSLMFQNSGDKIRVGVDWARVKYILTDGKTKFERSFCANQLAGAYKSIESVESMRLSGELETDTYEMLNTLSNKSLQVQFNACVTELGIQDAKNVNKTVLGELNLKH